MEKFIKFLKWIMEITKEPLKNLIYNETFIVLVAKLPIVPKWCIKAVLKWSLNKTINPIINEAYAELGFKIEVAQNEIKVKKIESSTTRDDWNESIDDLMQSGDRKRADRGNFR